MSPDVKQITGGSQYTWLMNQDQSPCVFVKLNVYKDKIMVQPGERCEQNLKKFVELFSTIKCATGMHIERSSNVAVVDCKDNTPLGPAALSKIVDESKGAETLPKYVVEQTLPKTVDVSEDVAGDALPTMQTGVYNDQSSMAMSPINDHMQTDEIMVPYQIPISNSLTDDAQWTDWASDTDSIDNTILALSRRSVGRTKVVRSTPKSKSQPTMSKELLEIRRSIASLQAKLESNSILYLAECRSFFESHKTDLQSNLTKLADSITANASAIRAECQAMIVKHDAEVNNKILKLDATVTSMIKKISVSESQYKDVNNGLESHKSDLDERILTQESRISQLESTINSLKVAYPQKIDNSSLAVDDEPHVASNSRHMLEGVNMITVDTSVTHALDQRNVTVLPEDEMVHNQTISDVHNVSQMTNPNAIKLHTSDDILDRKSKFRAYIFSCSDVACWKAGLEQIDLLPDLRYASHKVCVC